jgi:hypothetical protein
MDRLPEPDPVQGVGARAAADLPLDRAGEGVRRPVQALVTGDAAGGLGPAPAPTCGRRNGGRGAGAERAWERFGSQLESYPPPGSAIAALSGGRPVIAHPPDCGRYRACPAGGSAPAAPAVGGAPAAAGGASAAAGGASAAAGGAPARRKPRSTAAAIIVLA